MNDYTNYHDIDLNKKIKHDGFLYLERALNGFESHEVLINETIQSRVIVTNKWDAKTDIRKVIGRIEDIEIGNLLKINNHYWLVATFPEDNKIYRKAEIELCNDIFTLTFEGTKIIVGYNDFGQPIYDYTDPITYNIPCVLSTKIYSTVDNSPIPLPDGSIMIKMPYKIGQIPPINYVFTYHNDPYKVSTIEYDNVINGIGFIEMRLQRFTGGES